jgi:(R,R)-butanediol dehydrogenase/meso-butanediol dehydrogenase/diacetyl reductase
MRAAVLTDQRPALALAELADPEPGPGEVLLAVTGCGICGSDLHLAAHVGDVGAVLGHEIAGTVAGHGPGTDAGRWPVGTAVAVRPLAGCGTCRWCGQGRPDHCAGFGLLGLERPGGFAELTVAPAGELFALPARLSADEQALVEPLAVAHRAVSRAGLQAGDTVAVLGAGPIGLAVAAWARTLGVETVVASDPAPLRRDLATRLGASAVVDPGAEDPAAVLAELTGGVGPSVVFECSGRPGLIQAAVRLAAVEARVTVVGICLAMDEIFPYTAIQKELDLRFALFYGRYDFTATLDALDGGRLEAGAMVTDTVDLAGLPERFARLGRDTDGGKVIVRP